MQIGSSTNCVQLFLSFIVQKAYKLFQKISHFFSLFVTFAKSHILILQSLQRDILSCQGVRSLRLCLSLVVRMESAAQLSVMINTCFSKPILK